MKIVTMTYKCDLCNREVSEENLGAFKFDWDKAYDGVHQWVDVYKEISLCAKCMGHVATRLERYKTLDTVMKTMPNLEKLIKKVRKDWMEISK